MNYTTAIKQLKRAERAGYVPVNSGIVIMEVAKRFGGNTTGRVYGINIDGDGHDGRLFGCPKIIWSVEQIDELLGQ